ncbi:MAG: winged helix-turn-helix domain-containing protein [Candidatus Nanopusillus acidilobi]|jgi:predicted transcriptional regulator|nr:ArsR family transcriptional regulator [Euryarchaeota archaeon]
MENLEWLIKTMKVLSNPVRLKIIASLQREPKHIYALAKELGLSYPLVHLYLQSLEDLGIVKGRIDESKVDERERKIYSVVPFQISITPEIIEKLERGDVNE